MNRHFLFKNVVFFLFCFFHLNLSGDALFLFDQVEEKQRYIFSDLSKVERRPVTFYYGNEFAFPTFLKEIRKTYGVRESDIEEAVSAAFEERGLDLQEWLPKWDQRAGDATLLTQLTFHGKTVMIAIRLLSEALLLPSQVFLPGIIWDKKELLSFEDSQSLVERVKLLIGQFLDEYADARASYMLSLE